MAIHGNVLRNSNYESPELYSHFLEKKARVNLINPQSSSDSDGSGLANHHFSIPSREQTKKHSSKVKVMRGDSGIKVVCHGELCQIKVIQPVLKS